MSSKSKRLGSLADVFQAENLEGTVRKIKIDKIHPAENQPRQERQKGIGELAESLKQDGLLQPIVVTKKISDEFYTIIAGERRYHAAKLLGWSEIECKILDRDKKETYRIAIIENLQRENLSPYEEIEAISYLKKQYLYTDQELGGIFGKSRNYMTEILSISSLSPEEIKICKDLKIDNKNLLIQAVLSSKKGVFHEFIQMFSNGQISTVKEAKNFNKEKKIQNPILKNTNYDITKKENTIIIKSDDKESLNEIYKFVKKELAKNYP
ncbi:MAG: ParB/RepB/Spo0J family partition protein [Leptospiraceae bacterium]|nr:ParB/RepB/Spo0J family partition protein [Leptospiraceae bacterium]MCK6380896.1 ParB/RepB/Spo0J family partition protein [Leptospiraceae bacterium]NUM40050.1 ParB/RepB/Spo0J family partition protein [Leptospiraceae bacterium]